jgi:glycogen operon protein
MHQRFNGLCALTGTDLIIVNGMTTMDRPHNEANKEANQDGESHNNSWNCGVEGESDQPAVRTWRNRQARNLIASVLFSQGVPMISGGDEVGRTQRGNNNGYCQDNDLTWHPWTLNADQAGILAFVKKCLAIRKSQPVFQRRKFFQGRQIRGSQAKDVAWYEPSGKEMTNAAWNQHFVRCLGVKLAGDVMDEFDEAGERLSGDTIFLLFNAHHEAIPFTIPAPPRDHVWEPLLDSADDAEGLPPHAPPLAPGQKYELHGRSMAVLRARPPLED